VTDVGSTDVPEELAALLAGLEPMDVPSRLDALRAALVEADVEALLVTSLVNIRYLTGFTGSAGLLLVLPGDARFVTDGRYRDQATEQLAAHEVRAHVEIAGTDQREVVAGAAEGIVRLGLEADRVTWADQRAYAETWFPFAELIATSGLVEDLRVVKDPGEVARIGAAAAIADAALARVRHRLRDGPAERDFALALDTEMRHLGASGPSFETIVASGPNAARPHARPTDRHIGNGDLVVLDFGAVVDGYCSDISRTIMVGRPSATQRRLLEVVTAAQGAGIEAVRAGVPAAAVDTAARQVIDDAGWAEEFVHATGHGVGLEIHEAPRVAMSSDATLVNGNVVTVEPGVYLPGHGGARVEDTVLVTADGCRTLTHAPKLAAV